MISVSLAIPGPYRSVTGLSCLVFAAFLLIGCNNPAQVSNKPGFATAEKNSSQSNTPFSVHFLDVGTGESIIIDIGEHEIIIDGGRDPNALYDYVEKTKIIDGPIELVIVTNSYLSNWAGLNKLLGLDGKNRHPYQALEVWEPGRDDAKAPKAYLKFVAALQHIPNVTTKRPVEDTYAPAVKSNNPQPFTLPVLPEAKFTLLNADAKATGVNTVLDSSIVLMVEISGRRMLFTSGMLGKETSDPPDVKAKYIEGRLLDVDARHLGTLKADLMTVPLMGSERASTQAFINAVDPKHAVFFAGANYNIPRAPIINRYQKLGRRVYSTGLHQEINRDHVICTNFITEYNELTGGEGTEYQAQSERQKLVEDFACSYRSSVGKSGPMWRGSLKDGKPLSRDDLIDILEQNRSSLRNVQREAAVGIESKQLKQRVDALKGADLRGVDLEELELRRLDLREADLSWANLTKADVSDTLLQGANISYAYSYQPTSARAANFSLSSMTGAQMIYSQLPNVNLRGVDLTSANLTGAFLQQAVLTNATLSNAVMDQVDLRESTIIGTKMDKAHLDGADLSMSKFEPYPGFVPDINGLTLAKYLPSLTFDNSPHGLVELREAFKKAGLTTQRRELTYAIRHGERLKNEARGGWLESTFESVLFEKTCDYGMSPGRPLKILLWLWGISAFIYYLFLHSGRSSGLLLIASQRKKSDPGKFRVKVRKIRVGRRVTGNRWHRLRHNIRAELRALMTGVNFSLRNTVNLKFQWLEAGTWLKMIQRREFDLEATRWMRTIAGLQSLTSMYLIALWILTFFGNPFE